MITPTDPTASRRLVYVLLITIAAGSAAGRILSTQLVFEPSLHRAPGADVDSGRLWPASRPEPPTPTFSSNDRSRWATVRALVDDGTFVVGRRDRTTTLVSAPAALAATDPLSLTVLLEAGFASRVKADSGIVFEDGWKTVDKVLDPERLEFFSSKPPLLSVIVAGEYWSIKKTFGWTLKDRPQEVVRIVLITINLLPWIIYLWLLAHLLDCYGASDWASFYLLGAAAFGTAVTPFLITFNNHTLGTFGTLFALCAALRILAGEDRPWLFVVAGLCAGFTVTNELPAAAFAAGLFVLLVWRSPGRAFLWFLPVAVLPVAALLWTNYLELRSFHELAYSKFGGPWYEYEGSHWWTIRHTLRPTIDGAGHFEGKGAYLFNLLLGHHGVFSLTPIFLLTVVGLVMGMVGHAPHAEATPGMRSMPSGGPTELPRVLFPFTIVVSLIVLGFYVWNTESRNYGGWTIWPRWLMWLTPLWLLAALPAVEWLGRRKWGGRLCLVLLALSVMSMSYWGWNPWRHPWIYNFFKDRGWVAY